MLKKLASFLKRMELASDALVLDKIPNSAHASKVRERYLASGTSQNEKIELDADFTMELASTAAKAAHAIRELAKNRDPEGMFHLGDMYETGFGVEKNLSEAVSLYESAARAGFVPAQRRLGDAYFEGGIVEQSDIKALQWYRLGANGGDHACQKNLGIMFLHGVGAAKDYHAALKWLSASADQGNFLAQRNLGEMYLRGNGVDINKAEALKWFIIADKFGDPDARSLWSNLLRDVPAAESRIAIVAAENYFSRTKQ